MCKYHNKQNMDKCMKTIIKWLNRQGTKTYASCCGHSVYPMTVIVKDYSGRYYELFSETIIPRKKRFYVKDKKGYYYIPEVIKK